MTGISQRRVWSGAAALALMGSVVLAQGVPSQLRISEQDARQTLLDSINSGNPELGMGAKAFTALPAAGRVAVVDASVLWMKAYVNSPTFKAAYTTARDRMKPTPPQFEGTVDEELKRQQAQQAKEQAETMKAVASLPADQRAGLEAVMKQTNAMISSPEFQQQMRAGIQSDRTSRTQSYQEDLQKWQENYPANGLVLVARRLQTFLDVSGTVDFGAKLTSQGGRMQFVNPEYQAKRSEWKLCFRAGREAVTAGRTAATAWLKELPQR